MIWWLLLAGLSATALGFMLGATWASKRAGRLAAGILKDTYHLDAMLDGIEQKAEAQRHIEMAPTVVSPGERAWPRLVK